MVSCAWRGEPDAAVALVHAAPVRAQQAGGHLGQLGRLKAGHRLELRRQRPVRDLFEHGSGCGRVHAGPGQHPAQVLDHIRPGKGALFSLRERDRLLRSLAHLHRARTGRAARMRGRAARTRVVPHRRRDRLQAHAEAAREQVRPARVRLRQIQRAGLGRARGEVRRLRQPRQLALGGRAAVLLLEPRRAGPQVRGDRLAAGGEQPHHLPGDAGDLEAVPVIAGLPRQPEPAGQRLLQVLGDDRGDRADVLVVAQGIRCPPLPVDAGPGDVGDLGVDVQLHVAVPGGVLQPVRDRQVGLVPLAGLPAIDPLVMRPGAGIARLPLEVVKSRSHGLPDHRVDLGDQPGPVPLPRQVRGLAGQSDVLPERGVEDRDRLRQRNGQVEEQRALPRLLYGVDAQLAVALGSGMRLGGQQPGVDVRRFPVIRGRPAQLGAIRGLALPEQQVIGVVIDQLARRQAEC